MFLNNFIISYSDKGTTKSDNKLYQNEELQYLMQEERVDIHFYISYTYFSIVIVNKRNLRFVWGQQCYFTNCLSVSSAAEKPSRSTQTKFATNILSSRFI